MLAHIKGIDSRDRLNYLLLETNCAAEKKLGTNFTDIQHCFINTFRHVCTCLPILSPQRNKRAHRALGRSPEENVKGHSGVIYRRPQGHNLNNFGRGPLDDAIYQI